MAYIDREEIIKEFTREGVVINKRSLEYALVTWTSQKFNYATIDDAMKSSEFTERVKKSLQNMIDMAEHCLADTSKIKKIILEYPKIIAEPITANNSMSRDEVLRVFRDLGEIKLPFPGMTLIQGTNMELSGSKVDGFTHVFMEQIDKSVSAVCFIGNKNNGPIEDLIPFQMSLHIENNKFRLGLGVYEKQTCIPSTALIESCVEEILRCIYKTTINDSGEGCYISKPTPREIQVNKKKLKKRKAPLIEFRLIKIEPTKPQLPSLPQGTHASPRQHWRRGHWRNCKSGKRVFVNPALIGDEKNGKIIKDYIVGEPTHAH